MFLVVLFFLANCAKGSLFSSSGGLQNLVDCSAVDSQICPNPLPPPNVVFPAPAGTVSGTSLGCCKTNYLQCQNQLGTSLCKTLAQYTITPGQGNSEDVCTATTPPCTCQQALAAERSLTLRFCPTPPVCCPTCECHGDPHCSSFDRSKAGAVWAVCDDRGSTCLHQNSTCQQTMYAGLPCVWTPVLNGYSECLRDPSSPIPVMTMYTKQYKSYFNSSDNTVYTFSLELTLTVYGSISVIRVTDAGVTNTFYVNPQGDCMGTASYPLNSAGMIFIKNLPSGVWMQFQCMATGPKLPSRWDVNFVKDPWFVPAQLSNPPPISFAGYCATGVIAENSGGNPGGCRIMDRQVSMYYGCNINTPIASCKAQFCKKYSSRFVFPGLAGSVYKQCVTYTTSAINPTNFVQTACAMSKLMGAHINPDLCSLDYDCRVCMDAVADFPDQINQVLGSGPMVTTVAPTAPCVRNIVSVGVSRKTLSAFQSGVQIDFNNNGVWTGVFALLDAEIASCGGCNNVLFVNGSIPENQALLNPGQYRIRQCFGVNTDPQQALCDGPPGYNATVIYLNPVSGGAVSTPLGELYSEKKMVCSPEAYPKCPLAYQCCIWDRTAQAVAWTQCMLASKNNPLAYPDCDK
ncbi:hypothetical protein BASA81_007125 [Batrachochytrium salamandrivorans]|nr:hypothetical protein BASA81_007125 [Batrachochytrium salamandrivorans]